MSLILPVHFTGMSMEDLRKYENETNEKTNAKVLS